MSLLESVIRGPEAATLIVLLTIGLLIVVYALRTGVPPMPTGPGTRAVMLRLLPARLDGTVYDLGSGWGGLAFALARRYPENKVIGIELSPLPWLFARIRLLLWPRPNLSFRRADLMTVALCDAGALTCYLMPPTMQRLRRKLEAELQRDTVVVSYSFAFDDWTPDLAVLEAESGPLPVYRYCVRPDRGQPGP